MIIASNTRILSEENHSSLLTPDSVSLSIGTSQVVTPTAEPIDLTSTTLDSRVQYIGPPHTYININGNFLTSNENEWPLEYDNSVIIGRHEPEKSATNYLLDSSYTDISETQEGLSTSWIMSQSAGVAIQSSVPGSFAYASAQTNYVNVAVFSEGGTGFLVTDNNPGLSADWTYAVSSFTNPDDQAQIRWYIARLNSANYFYGKAPTMPLGNYVSSVWRKLNDFGILLKGPQLEDGSIPTSPIVNAGTAQTTRPESSVTVSNDQGSTGINVYYSDGTVLSIDFTGDTINIPLSSLPWAQRYMTKIEYFN